MRPGITIQHSRDVAREEKVVRSDVTGFIGVVNESLWPNGVSRGDFLEIRVESFAELANQQGARLVDPVTLRAVKQFFQNGGRVAHVIGLCIDSEDDLLAVDPFSLLFHSLIDRLRGNEDIGILTMPVLAYLPCEYVNGTVSVRCQPVMELLLQHCCEMNNRFLVLDTPRDLHEGALFGWVNAFREANRAYGAYGAIYYPWLMNGDEVFPPSGCVAGVFAGVEADEPSFGVRLPPANIVMRGITHPQVALSFRESEDFVAAHINPILSQPTRGVVIWGARTLSLDERWMHINSRRIMNLIVEQLRRDSEWAVFENQRPELWDIIQRTANNRLETMWTAGLLTGDAAGEEYLVQCDEEINTLEARDSGQVNVRVMVRPISTTEFIVVDLRLGR